MDIDALVTKYQSIIDPVLKEVYSGKAAPGFVDGFATCIASQVFLDASSEVGNTSAGEVYGDPRPVYNNLQAKAWTKRLESVDFAEGEKKATSLIQSLWTAMPEADQPHAAEIVYLLITQKK